MSPLLTAQALLQTMDAKIWAEQFMLRFADRKPDIDEALMLSWFASAIMAGYDQAKRDLRLA